MATTNWKSKAKSWFFPSFSNQKPDISGDSWVPATLRRRWQKGAWGQHREGLWGLWWAEEHLGDRRDTKKHFGKVGERWARRLCVHTWHRPQGHESGMQAYCLRPWGTQESLGPGPAMLPLAPHRWGTAEHGTGITKLKQVFDTTNLISLCYEKSHRAVFIPQAQHSEQTGCCNL